MEKSALTISEPQAAPLVGPPPVQEETRSNIVAYPCIAGVALTEAKESSHHVRKRRGRLALFIKVETIAFFFLVLTLAGASSRQIREIGLLLAFQIAMVLAALAVAIIPVVFYGTTRQKYRYGARHYRAR